MISRRGCESRDDPPRAAGTTGRRVRHSSTALVCALVCVVLAAGASAQGMAAKPVLRIGDGAGFGTCGSMNPTAHSTYVPEIAFAYEPFMHKRADGSIGPGLATAWKVAAGNKTITLWLRHDARFSDGTPVTAQAVKTWWEWRAQPARANGYDATMGPLRVIDVLSKYVVRITLKSPNPIFAQVLASTIDFAYPISPRAIEVVKADPKSTILDRQTFGAGPYVYDPSQSVTNDHCTFVPNKYYFDKPKIRFSKVVIRPLLDANAQLAGLRAGQLDIVERAAANTVQAAKDAGFKVVYSPAPTALGIIFDHTGKLVPAFGDVRVRQAINYALDRKRYLALYGRG
jgi:peptide/nickel transport system substrate-binding protein